MCHRDPHDKGWCDQHESDYPRDEDTCVRATQRLTMDARSSTYSEPLVRIAFSERELDVLLPRMAR